MKRVLAFLCTCMVMSGISFVAHAEVVLDQEKVSVSPVFAGSAVQGSFLVAQTFTVGMDGTLDSVAVQARQVAGRVMSTEKWFPNSESATLYILPIHADGAPADDLTLALATVTLRPDDFPEIFKYAGEFISADLAPFNIEVSAGDVLAIALTASSIAPVTNCQPSPVAFCDSNGGYAWLSGSPGSTGTPDYPRGVTFVRSLATESEWRRSVTYPADIPLDAAFRTYVDVGDRDGDSILGAIQ